MTARRVTSTLTVGVPYDDVAAGIVWITGILGLQVAQRWGPDHAPVFAYLAWRDSLISVWKRPEADNTWSQVGPVSISLHAPDDETVRSAYERALAAGAHVERDLQETRNPAAPESYLGFELRDPEGHLWGMGTWGPSYELP